MGAEDAFASIEPSSPITQFQLPTAFCVREGVSNSHNMQFGKGGAVDAIIKREQAIAFLQSMSANEKVRQSAVWLTCSLFAAAICVLLKRFSGNSPDRFIHGPIDHNTGVL